MLFGFDISSISAIIITDQYVTYFHNPAGLWQGGKCGFDFPRINETSDQEFWVPGIGAALAGGSIVGASTAGFLSDKIGRRDSIAFGVTVLQRFSRNNTDEY